ncbi:MAG: DUF342 domain-containing protein [Christensenellaceae bacterium]|jgi:uncharacterized protein (DUF342 family)
MADGRIKLDYREDGVYLTLIPPDGDGKPMDMAQAVGYLKRKNIAGADASKIGALISAGQAQTEKIAEAQEECIVNEEMEVTVSADGQEAWLRLFPADEDGERLTEDEIRRELEDKYKVTFGLIDDNIKRIVSDRLYYTDELVAKGQPPVDGEDAKLTYHIETEQMDYLALAAENENDKIDWRNISKFEKAEQDQVLVTKTPATEPVDGISVKGAKIGAKKGRDAILPAGKNTYLSEDKLSLLSKIAGRLEFAQGKIVVSPVLRIPGDVDMSVGNVRFDGDIEIMGNVNSGFLVEAGGNIVVHGLVENAMLDAKGNITVKSGIRGADKSKVSAGGDIIANFIERTNVEAGGNITAEYLIQGNVACEGYVDVSLNRGAIMGGVVGAGKYVVAKVIGTDANITTTIEIGVSPQKRNRMKELQANVEQLGAVRQRLELALAAAEKNKTDANAKARLEVSMQIGSLTAQINELNAEGEEIGQAIQDAKGGHVHVLDKIYRGTKIVIGNSAYMLRQDDQYVTYSRHGKDIASEACFYAPPEKRRRS